MSRKRPAPDAHQRAIEVVARSVRESIDLIQETSPARAERRATLLAIMSELARREGYGLSFVALVPVEVLVEGRAAFVAGAGSTNGPAAAALQIDEEILDPSTPAELVHQLLYGLHMAGHEMINRLAQGGVLAPVKTGDTPPPTTPLH